MALRTLLSMLLVSVSKIFLNQIAISALHSARLKSSLACHFRKVLALVICIFCNISYIYIVFFIKKKLSCLKYFLYIYM